MSIIRIVTLLVYVSFANSLSISRNTTKARPQQSVESRIMRVERDSVGNVQFDLPDLAVSWDAGNGARYQLEAFRDKRNDVLLVEGKDDPKKFSELRWVSLGQPRLLKARKVFVIL